MTGGPPQPRGRGAFLNSVFLNRAAKPRRGRERRVYPNRENRVGKKSDKLRTLRRRAAGLLPEVLLPPEVRAMRMRTRGRLPVGATVEARWDGARWEGRMTVRSRPTAAGKAGRAIKTVEATGTQLFATLETL